MLVLGFKTVFYLKSIMNKMLCLIEKWAIYRYFVVVITLFNKFRKGTAKTWSRLLKKWKQTSVIRKYDNKAGLSSESKSVRVHCEKHWAIYVDTLTSLSFMKVSWMPLLTEHALAHPGVLVPGLDAVLHLSGDVVGGHVLNGAVHTGAVVVLSGRRCPHHISHLRQKQQVVNKVQYKFFVNVLWNEWEQQ